MSSVINPVFLLAVDAADALDVFRRWEPAIGFDIGGKAVPVGEVILDRREDCRLDGRGEAARIEANGLGV